VQQCVRKPQKTRSFVGDGGVKLYTIPGEMH